MPKTVSDRTQEALEEVWRWRDEVRQNYADYPLAERGKRMWDDVAELIKELGLEVGPNSSKQAGKAA